MEGPFYHGTRSALEVGAELVPGRGSNFHQGRVSNHLYFSALVETAVWGAELAAALAGGDSRGRIYLVQPVGPFEDDPNVTNKRFRATRRSPSGPGTRCGSWPNWSPGKDIPPTSCRPCWIIWHGFASRASMSSTIDAEQGSAGAVRGPVRSLDGFHRQRAPKSGQRSVPMTSMAHCGPVDLARRRE